MLNGFGVVVNSLGARVKPYLPQICGTILWRLNNKAAKVRQQAADLISRIANVMHTCGEVRSNGERGREREGIFTLAWPRLLHYWPQKHKLFFPTVRLVLPYGRNLPSVSQDAGCLGVGGWSKCVGGCVCVVATAPSLIVNNDDAM